MTWHPDIPLEYRDQIVTGDARELAARLPDASVDLCFCDPIYNQAEDYEWLSRECMRLLKPDSAVLVFYGIGYMPQTLAALLRGGLRYRWQGIWYISNGMKRADMGYCNYSPFLWMEKGHSKPRVAVGDIAMVAIPDPGNAKKHQRHHWEKQPAMIARYVRAFTQPGAVILDPFTGGGTIPAVARMLDRHSIAFEIDPDTAERARARVAATQPMHPVFLEEQAEFAL
jgi:adenine-specific DNA-methyltransferase